MLQAGRSVCTAQEPVRPEQARRRFREARYAKLGKGLVGLNEILAGIAWIGELGPSGASSATSAGDFLRDQPTLRHNGSAKDTKGGHFALIDIRVSRPGMPLTEDEAKVFASLERLAGHTGRLAAGAPHRTTSHGLWLPG